MSFNIYGDFDPDDRGIPEEYVEFTENDLCWGNDVNIPAGSYFRYGSGKSWDYTKDDTRIYLCCTGDRLEVVEPGQPSKRIIYVVA